MVRTEPLAIPMTPRLERERELWRHSRRPSHIEVPGPGQRSVWDFPRPPAVERVLERVTVTFAGRRIADTEHCLRLCETASPPSYYIPRADIAMDHLRRCAGSSHCEWKGRASYFDLVVDGRVSRQAAWSYEQIAGEYRVLLDHLAFYVSRTDRCTVGDDVATAQPGGFYGGWITSELTGPWKGGAGTVGW